MRMRKKWWMCLSVAVFLGIMLIFCIMNDNKRIEESFSEQSEEERSNLKGTKIATIILLEDQTEKVMQAAMRNTARKYGAIVVEGQSGGELERETVLVNQYIEQGVDAFCIYPVSPTGSAAALEKVAKQGIAIYSVDLNMESEWQTGYCEANQYNIGQMVGIECANYIRKYFPDRKPKVAIIEFSALLPNTSADRTNGFLSATRNLIEVVQDVDAWDSSTSTPIVKEVLDANPDLDLIFCANEGGTVGAVMAVRNAGLNIPVFGIDITEQLVNMMLDDDNILQTLGGQDPVQLGERSMENLCLYLMGQEYDSKITIPGVILSRQRPGEAREYIEMTKRVLEESTN